MSHFTVAVIHREEQNIEELLAPYQENNMGDCPEEYLTFNDCTKECEERWKEKKEEGDYKNNSFEFFVEDWFGYEKNEATGKYGYWENPNAKWDWYEVGGRWEKLLKLKVRNKVWEQETANTAKLKDIDFNPTEEEIKEAERFWDLKINKVKPESTTDEEMLKWDYHNDEYYLEKYKTKENYVKYQTSFSTYAVITHDGQWHSKGKMGWFGFSSEHPKESYDFGITFKEKFIDNSDQNLYMTIVDCHI